MRAVVRAPGFARLWTAALFSEVGEWIMQIALPVLAYQLTGSAASTAAMMILGLVPTIALSPVAGLLADGRYRHRVLCLVSIGQALVAVPLLLVDSRAQLPVLYVVMALQAGLASLAEPVRNALVPQVVGTDRITAANGLMSVNASVARLGGGWLGGLLLALGGLDTTVVVYLVVLAITAALFAAPFLGAQSPGAAGHGEAERTGLLRQWTVGLREIRGNADLRVLTTVSLLLSLAQGMFLVLFLVFVLRELRGSEADVGLFRGVQAVGGLAAGFAVAAFARRVRPGSLLAWGALAMGLCSAVLWNTPHLTTSLAVFTGLFMVVGAPGVIIGSGQLSAIQTLTPPPMIGRVLSTTFAGMAAAQALGMQMAGAVADTAGLPVLLNLQAAVFLLAGALVLLRLPARRAPALT